MTQGTESPSRLTTLWPTLKPYAYIGAGFWAFLLFGCVLIVLSDLRNGRLRVLLEIPEMFVGTAAIAVVGTAGLGGLVMLVKALGNRQAGDDGSWYHGTARFATDDEIRELTIPPRTPLPPGSFYLGPFKDGPVVLPHAVALQHGVIFGGTGTGKSRGYFLPNCAWARGTSLVVSDIKYELWDYTSGFHRRPLRYAPLDPRASEVFNWVPLCTTVRAAQLYARAILEAGHAATDAESSFWTDSETMFLSALFAHTATLEEPTPLTAYRLFARQRPEELKKQLLNSASEVAQEQANIFYEMTDAKVRGGIVPAMAAKLQWLRDEDVARFTSAGLTAPNFAELRRHPTAVYYCLPEQDVARLKPLTSLFFTLLLEQIAGARVQEGGAVTPVTMMLDEFANIGTIPDFATTITLARGRGVAIWLGVQSLSQLEDRYGKAKAEIILGNCTTQVALHGLKYATAEYVSKSLGETTVVAQRTSYNDGGGIPAMFGGGGKPSTTYSRTEHRRPLLTPDEVSRIGENQALVRTGNRHPMWLWKIYYDEPPVTARARGLGPARAVKLAPMVAPPPCEEVGVPPPLPDPD